MLHALQYSFDKHCLPPYWFESFSQKPSYQQQEGNAFFKTIYPISAEDPKNKKAASQCVADSSGFHYS
jgi:hypothetical protein